MVICASLYPKPSTMTILYKLVISWVRMNPGLGQKCSQTVFLLGPIKDDITES